MRTMTIDGVTAHYNSDLSGDVEFGASGFGMRVPGELLIAIVAQLVTAHRIAQLEHASAKEVLGLPE